MQESQYPLKTFCCSLQTRSTVQYCEDHNDKEKEYFCETCRYTVCSDCCILGSEHKVHKLVKLEDAADTHIKELETLKTLLNDKEKKYMDTIFTIDRVKEHLEIDLKAIRGVLGKVSNTIDYATDCEIVSIFAELSVEIQQCIDINPPDIAIPDIDLTVNGHTSLDMSSDSSQSLELYEAEEVAPLSFSESDSITADQSTNAEEHSFVSNAILSTPPKWQICGTITTSPNAKFPQSIGIHPNGDIIVSNYKAHVAVFSDRGTYKHSFMKSQSASDIAVTPNGHYIITESGQFCMYDEDGNVEETFPTYDMNHELSNPRSVAVDSHGRIAVAVGAKTISIHQPDGDFISKFGTTACPDKLTWTPDGKIIGSFMDNTLQIMDQSGLNVNIIDPPHNMQSWKPVYVYCGKNGELYVGNWGETKGVYRYVPSDKGEYRFLDRVAVMSKPPYGIALSQDEEKLFIVDYYKNEVQIYGTKDSRYANFKPISLPRGINRRSNCVE